MPTVFEWPKFPTLLKAFDTKYRVIAIAHLNATEFSPQHTELFGNACVIFVWTGRNLGGDIYT